MSSPAPPVKVSSPSPASSVSSPPPPVRLSFPSSVLTVSASDPPVKVIDCPLAPSKSILASVSAVKSKVPLP